MPESVSKTGSKQIKKTSSKILWIGVNKNGKLSIHAEEPKRNIDRWESNKPFCNSIIYNQFSDMCKKIGMNWENECEIIEICYE